MNGSSVYQLQYNYKEAIMLVFTLGKFCLA